MRKYQIICAKVTGEYIVLEEYKTMEMAELMFNWYIAHKSFFRGELSIKVTEV